jgi:hypothetical protein
VSKEVRLEFLKRDLKTKEREKAKVWESFWWILWIFLPVIGLIIMIIFAIQKANRYSRLENDCNDLRDQVHELESEIMKEKLENRL